MERKYLKDLIEWNNDPDRKPLLVLGARQVGKTYLIKNIFAERYYPNKYLRIDCSDDLEFVEYVNKNNNLQNVINYITIKYNFTLDNNHLLIIDEVQNCLPIIKMLKHFCENRPDIRIICSGSLVRIKLFRVNKQKGIDNNSQFLYPVGKINHLNIYPLSFDEFLMNYNIETYNYVLDCYTNKKEIPDGIHQKLMDIFYNYLFVGGMPEVVNTYLMEKDNIDVYKSVVKKIKNIYVDYLNDMGLFQASPESIVRSRLIYESIYSQLNKENSNFKSSLIDGCERNRDVITPISWLVLSNVVNQSFQLKEKVTSPLIENDSSMYRLYLSDIGLFTYQSGLSTKDFILDKDNTLSGIYFENYLATELTSRENKLFYWKGKRNSEFEFLINVGKRIIPIDSKKTRGSLNSIEEYRNHNKKDLVIKVSKNHYGYDNDKEILTLPFYYFPFFLNEIKENESIIC